MRRFKWIAGVATLALALGTLPAFAAEGDTPEEGTSAVSSPLATILVAEYGMTLEEIAGLQDLGLGFGEIFKLKTLSLILNVDTATLLAGATVDPETGEYEFDWAALEGTLTAEQLAFLGTLPRNFGQFVSAHQRHHGRDQHQPDHGNGGGHGHGG